MSGVTYSIHIQIPLTGYIDLILSYYAVQSSSHSNSVSYETYLADREESRCVLLSLISIHDYSIWFHQQIAKPDSVREQSKVIVFQTKLHFKFPLGNFLSKILKDQINCVLLLHSLCKHC